VFSGPATLCRIDITSGCRSHESRNRQQGARYYLTRWDIVGYNRINNEREKSMKKTITKLTRQNRKLKLQLIKLKAMLLVNTNIDWNFSEVDAKEEFQNLYNLIGNVK
jgi:hypothetical protein